MLNDGRDFAFPPCRKVRDRMGHSFACRSLAKSRSFPLAQLRVKMTALPRKDPMLSPRFKDHIEWRLRRAAEVREASCGDDIANALFSGLRA